MFTLRTYLANGVQTNTIIGKKYSVISRLNNYDQFKLVFSTLYKTDHVMDTDPKATDITKSIYAFITSGEDIYPLAKVCRNFIMMDGKTIDNLTFANRP